MEFESSYKAKLADAQGMVEYTSEEQKVWQMLHQRQMSILPGRACDEYFEGLRLLNLSSERIPQLPEVNECLEPTTGWRVVPVNALISAREFFNLLANRCFPAATFIRRIEELNYVKEPDIFHELFGHCPLITNLDFANFMQAYAQKVLSMPEADWALMQRLFWFTVEFGLIKTKDGLRAYGGGILSSIGETSYSVESHLAMRAIYDPVVVMRTPYRIDQMQPIYFVIDSYKQLYDLMSEDFGPILKEVKRLGEYPPFFEVDKDNPSIHIHAC